MNLAWIGVAAAVAFSLVVVVVKRLAAAGERRHRADGDLGAVSEGWLSEQRGRKDS